MKRLAIVLCLCGLLSGCGASTTITPTNSPAESLAPSQIHPSVSSAAPSESESNVSSQESVVASKNSSVLANTPSAQTASSASSTASSTASLVTSSVTSNTPNPSSTPSASSLTPVPESLQITKGGEYLLTGTKRNATIRVNAPEEVVTLTLSGATVTNANGPALYIAAAKKVNLVLAKGTKNILSDGSSYSLTDGTTTLDAALFSRSDLHLSGEGSLTVQGNCKHGIVSKDDLEIQSGTYQITAKNVALEGKDRVTVSGGNFTLKAGTDGIRATNEENPNKGAVLVQGGTLTVTAGNDGIQAATNITVAGGEMTLTVGQSGVQAEGAYLQTGGTVTLLGTVGSGKAILNCATAAAEGGSLFAFGDGTKSKHLTAVKDGCALQIPFSTQPAGTPFVLQSQGKPLVEITPPVPYSLALIYTPALTLGDYTLTLGNQTHTFTVSTNLFTLK